MNCSEIRTTFVNFYKDLGFQLLPPAPMLHPSIPMSFVMSAGLVQIETSLTKAKNRSGNKFILVQNCFRHFDLKSVGTDDVHLSLFEMPGAFIFGKNNRETAISIAWKLATEELGIDAERIWVSYFSGGNFKNQLLPEDRQTYHAWREAGVPENRLIGLGIEQNYWIQGGSLQGQESDLRKCGPHTEMFYDCGSDRKCSSSCQPGCRCGRFVEFSNTLFISNEFCPQTGTFFELANPFVETVIGTERVAMLSQNVDSVFAIQGYCSVIRVIQGFIGQTNLSVKLKIESERIIADHLRALYILIADGAPPPGKGGRSHIIKQLVRGVVTRQMMLGINSYDFLPTIIEAIAKAFGDSVKSTSIPGNKIKLYFDIESQRFQKTIKRGQQKIRKLLIENNGNVISESQKCILKKKWGMPDRLTEMVLFEKGFSLAETEY